MNPGILGDGVVDSNEPLAKPHPSAGPCSTVPLGLEISGFTKPVHLKLCCRLQAAKRDAHQVFIVQADPFRIVDDNTERTLLLAHEITETSQ